MPLVIDAWNVLHQTGVLPPEMAGVGLKGLGALIKGSRWGKEAVLLVCDGMPKGPHGGLPQGIKIAFSGPEREADDLIERRIALTSAPGQLTVVSSDRRLRTAGRKRGCKVMTSEAFLQRLVLDASRPTRSAPKRPTKVDLPQDMIDQAQAMLDDAAGLPPPHRGNHGPIDAGSTATPPPVNDSGPLPQAVIDEAIRLIRTWGES